MQIRAMSQSDLPQLAALLQQFWEPPEPQNVENMRKKFKEMADDDDYILLVAYDGKLLGSVTGIICQELYGECKPFLLMENMIVDLDNRQKGVGSALFKEMEKRARERGCRQVILVTESNRPEAKAFYAAMGFPEGQNAGFKKKL